MDWSTVIGLFSNSSAASGSGWGGMASSLISKDSGGSTANIVSDLLANYSGTKGTGESSGSALLCKLPELLANSNSSKETVSDKSEDKDSDDKSSEIANTVLRAPGSKAETKTGKIGSKVGSVVGTVLGNTVFSGFGGSFWGGMAGEDAGARTGDIIDTLFS